jgi:hypothetical protein
MLGARAITDAAQLSGAGQGRAGYLSVQFPQSHDPLPCNLVRRSGSCWAHGAMSSLADRTKIMRKAVWPDINFAIQVILNCGQDIAGTCDGGDPGVCTPSTRSAVVVW